MSVKETGKVILDCRVVSSPEVIKSYGIEKIYEVIVEYQCSKTRTCTIAVNYSNATCEELHIDDVIRISGNLRSIRITEESKDTSSKKTFKAMKIYIFMTSYELLDEMPKEPENLVEFYGAVVANEPKLRKSYKDNDVNVTNFTLNISRGSGRVSYISCAAWNSLAVLVSKIKKDTVVNCTGNIQSRVNDRLDRIFVEISISSLEVVSD